MIVRAVLAVLLLCGGAFAPALADDKLLSQAMVEEKGPIAFKVAKVGEFELLSLSQEAKRGEPCHVTIQALTDRIAAAHRSGELRFEPGQTSVLGLALTTCSAPGGEVLCCMGAGSDCEISVGVRSLY